MKTPILSLGTALLLFISACQKDSLDKHNTGNDQAKNPTDTCHNHGSHTTGGGSGSGSGSGSGGQTGNNNFPLQKPTEWNCSFESHLDKVKPLDKTSYFVADVVSPVDSFNIYQHFTVNCNSGFQHGRAGCYDIKEAWMYHIISPKQQYNIMIRFENIKKLPNLQFMRTGDYYFNGQEDGYVWIQMEYRGKTYQSQLAVNDPASGQFLRITGYESLSRNWKDLYIAYQFNADLKAQDGSMIQLRNVVGRSGTIGE